MEPMSHTKRRTYLIISILVFIILTPIVIFYAMGFRFDPDQKAFITERGGIYVYVPIPSTNIFIDGSLEDTTGIFNKEYLDQNIKPGRYFVRVENEGYRDWQKYIEVDPQRVSSVYPFLVLEEFKFEEVSEFVEEDLDNATTTQEVLNPLYGELASLFVNQQLATTTVEDLDKEPEIIKRIFGNVQIWYEDQKFYAEWLARGDFLPAFFCENGQCLNPLVFLEVNSPVIHFDFYPGRDDVVIFVVEGGSIHVAEVDKRPEQTVVEVYEGIGEDVDFRISGRDTLIIKDGDRIVTTKLIK